MKRVLLAVVAVAVVGCGSTSAPKPTVRAPLKAGALHQPGAPVVRPTVRHRAVAPGTSGDSGGVALVGGASCGVERWAVKTATDPAAGQINLTPVVTTIAALDALPVQSNADGSRVAGPEETVYQITGTLTGVKQEADSDFHLVMTDGPATMIVEIPDAPACTQPPATSGVSVLEQQIEQARTAFIQEFGQPTTTGFTTIGHQVTVTGVGFYDRLHGQTGVAPNGFELHPVLSIRDP